jgi:RHS repeat-associated protein
MIRLKLERTVSVIRLILWAWLVPIVFLWPFPTLEASQEYQNLNLAYDVTNQHTPGQYCPENYTYGIRLHWTVPPQGNVCFYQVYRNGTSLGTTGGTSYFIAGTSGCFGSYSNFMASVNAILRDYYYGMTYQVVAVRSCRGLSDLVDQKTNDSEAATLNKTNPPLTKQANQEKKTFVAEPINVSTGEMYTKETDILTPAREIPLELSRTYNSGDDFNGMFGYGWRSNFDITLAGFPDASVVETDENGVCTVYKMDPATNTYAASTGKYSKLTINPDYTYNILRKHGRMLTFNTQGKLIKIQEKNGNALTIIRDFNGNITEVNDASGRKLLFSYDNLARVTQITDPANRVWKYAYGANGDLAQVIDPLNNITTYQYDSNHKLVQKTDANGHALYFQYDSSGRAIHSWQDGNVNEITLLYNPDHSLTTTTDSRGNSTRYEYNAYGLVTKITDAQDNIQTTLWDTNLNKTSQTEQKGNTFNFTYDNRGNLLTTTDPQNHTTTLTYTPDFDFVKTATDTLGNTTTCDYDTKGNIIKITNALGGMTTNAYDSLGQLLNVTDAKNNITHFTYDTNGNLLTSTDALNNITTFSYDFVGNRTQVKDAQNNVTQFTYDGLNRLLKVTYPNNSIASFTYDALGNKTSATNNASETTGYTYDINNKVTSITNPLGKVVSFAYDTEGNRVSVTDQNSNQTTYQYDSLNRLISETDPAGLTKTCTYDSLGNKISVTDANQNTTTYEYDSLNRLTKTNYLDANSVSFGYDALGRRTGITDSSGITTYAYDALNRLTQVQGPTGENDTIQYSYDSLGNRVSMTLPGNKVIQYAYDALNRLVSVTDYNNKTTAYSYDSVGNPQNILYPNNVEAIYSFDSLHRLTHLTNQLQNGDQTILSDFGYAYDQAGRRSKIILPDGEVDFTYDAAGELTSETRVSGNNPTQINYEYDPAGNRTRMVKNGIEHLYGYNSANQLTQENISGPSAMPIIVTGTVSDANGIDSMTVNGSNATLNGNSFSSQVNLSNGLNTITVTARDIAGNTATQTVHVTYNQTSQIVYAYDANGNLISKQSAGQTLNLSYDYENRLKTVTSPAANISYAYDGEGRRVSVTDGATVMRYFYDGKDVVLERDGLGNPTSTYLRNPYSAGGIGGIIHSQQGSSPEVYYSYDGSGSVSNLSDVDGVNVQSYSYDAFGNTTASTGALLNNHRFLTKELDPSGLVYFGQRYYDPSIGRFITPDPLGMVDGPNMYLYCANDPVNLVDWWGLCKEKSWRKIILESINNYVDISFSTGSLSAGITLERGGMIRNTLTAFTVGGASLDISIGALPSASDNVLEIGLGLGDYLGIGFFYGRPNSIGNFDIGGLVFHVGIGLGTPVYISGSSEAKQQ